MVIKSNKEAVTIHCTAREARIIACLLAEEAQRIHRLLICKLQGRVKSTYRINQSVEKQMGKLSEEIQDAIEW